MNIYGLSIPAGLSTKMTNSSALERTAPLGRKIHYVVQFGNNSALIRQILRPIKCFSPAAGDPQGRFGVVSLEDRICQIKPGFLTKWAREAAYTCPRPGESGIIPPDAGRDGIACEFLWTQYKCRAFFHHMVDPVAAYCYILKNSEDSIECESIPLAHLKHLKSWKRRSEARAGLDEIEQLSCDKIPEDSSTGAPSSSEAEQPSDSTVEPASQRATVEPASQEPATMTEMSSPQHSKSSSDKNEQAIAIASSDKDEPGGSTGSPQPATTDLPQPAPATGTSSVVSGAPAGVVESSSSSGGGGSSSSSTTRVPKDSSAPRTVVRTTGSLGGLPSRARADSAEAVLASTGCPGPLGVLYHNHFERNQVLLWEWRVW